MAINASAFRVWTKKQGVFCWSQLCGDNVLICGSNHTKHVAGLGRMSNFSFFTIPTFIKVQEQSAITNLIIFGMNCSPLTHNVSYIMYVLLVLIIDLLEVWFLNEGHGETAWVPSGNYFHGWLCSSWWRVNWNRNILMCQMCQRWQNVTLCDKKVFKIAFLLYMYMYV